MTRITTLDLPALHRATVGFDRMFDQMERSFDNAKGSGYPPYNVVRKSENEYIISIAVAGFTMDNIEITQDNKTLTIEGIAPEQDDTVEYLHKGIAGRGFRREFTLAEFVEVSSAELELGVLNVFLDRNIPEELQPRKIEITSK